MAIILAAEISTRPTADPKASASPDPAHGSENPTWGEERIANELSLKLGIHVSPRTVRKCLHPRPPNLTSRGDLRWSTFLRLHAEEHHCV